MNSGDLFSSVTAILEVGCFWFPGNFSLLSLLATMNLHSSDYLAKINRCVFVNEFYLAIVFVYLMFYNFTVVIREPKTTPLLWFWDWMWLVWACKCFTWSWLRYFYRIHSNCYITFKTFPFVFRNCSTLYDDSIKAEIENCALRFCFLCTGIGLRQEPWVYSTGTNTRNITVVAKP